MATQELHSIPGIRLDHHIILRTWFGGEEEKKEKEASVLVLESAICIFQSSTGQEQDRNNQLAFYEMLQASVNINLLIGHRIELETEITVAKPNLKSQSETEEEIKMADSIIPSSLEFLDAKALLSCLRLSSESKIDSDAVRATNRKNIRASDFCESANQMELGIMLLECCSQERTYLRYYGLLGQRFCMINKVHQENFENCFVQQYSMIHRLETNKLRNVAKFFAHLLGAFALPWHVLAYIRLTEEDTTSSSCIFIKILFQDLSEHLGIRLLNERLTDPIMQDSFESIFPKDNPNNTRFSINFFTSIGLGDVTENLREYLKNMPRLNYAT
ncbi:Pre-mRNA-splicing factor cwc22 [Camellia lanceoleosa]|uniref:Pre-mRNA-splicing factor cwc22 n=1 Tax=Camellia lanceoleosa TaxID=1840588 RepID=A0ACC0F6G2_9ERIC|nr:Pre-mRNA-splicing factor cwc22 [Camellia lanceoleosa]